jgi:hypothetical protein
MVRAVNGVAGRVFTLEKVGKIARAYLGRLGARGVQDRAATAIDRANVVWGKAYNGGARCFGIGGVIREGACPATPETGDPPPPGCCLVNDGLDRRIQPRNVASPGEDSQMHASSLVAVAIASY